jgi:hypothetical protein
VQHDVKEDRCRNYLKPIGQILWYHHGTFTRYVSIVYRRDGRRSRVSDPDGLNEHMLSTSGSVRVAGFYVLGKMDNTPHCLLIDIHKPPACFGEYGVPKLSTLLLRARSASVAGLLTI